MSYAVALLYVLIGIHNEASKTSVVSPQLGSVEFTSYSGNRGKCAIHLVKSGGQFDSFVTVRPMSDSGDNLHYTGLSDDGPVLARSYSTYVMPANHKQGFGDYVLLNKADDFNITFESRDKKSSETKVVNCNPQSCACSVKL